MSTALFDPPRRCNTTLGILAGGLGSRLGGLDKAWLQRDGVAQVVRCHRAFADVTRETRVSANRALARYREYGLAVVSDAGGAGRGPIGGLQALAEACASAWLFTVPVDLLDFNADIALRLMDEANIDGAFAVDADGTQPLIALWSAPRLRARLRSAHGETGAIHALQAGLAMRPVPVPGLRFGNLNTPEDLRDAGISFEEFDGS